MRRPDRGTVELDAYAKLNAFLRVISKRADGYHELETLVLPLALADRIRVTVSDGNGDTSERFGIDDVSGPQEIVRAVPADDANLMIRAAEVIAQRVGSGGRVRMTVAKRIPVGGGFGGGSADAAAVLRALDGLFDAGLTDEALSEMGASIGSDVPALLARRAVRARGRGERIEHVDAASFRWVIARFAAGVSTAEAFGWWDEDGRRGGGQTEGARDHSATAVGAIVGAVSAGDPQALGPLLFNDLETPVFRRRPDVAEAKRLLLRAGLPGAVMCGSGASVAGLVPAGATDHEMEALRSALERLTGLPPIATESLAT